MLTNLCSNAAKFTPRGQISVSAVEELLETGNATIRFEIKDTGVGIRPDRIGALFSPFVQGDDSTTRKFGGTGLGLAICKQLVAMMGGSIGVSSREGEGSTFWFTAVLGVPAQNAPQPAHALPPNIESSRIGPPARILVADDNVVNRMVVLAQLEKLGYDTGEVANGSDAVDAVLHGGYDLVLMDCHMPLMDGFEATRRIRDSERADIPIVAITADAMAEDRERCLREGMIDYLSKPVDLAKLSAVLTRWLSPAKS